MRANNGNPTLLNQSISLAKELAAARISSRRRWTAIKINGPGQLYTYYPQGNTSTGKGIKIGTRTVTGTVTQTGTGTSTETGGIVCMENNEVLSKAVDLSNPSSICRLAVDLSLLSGRGNSERLID